MHIFLSTKIMSLSLEKCEEVSCRISAYRIAQFQTNLEIRDSALYRFFRYHEVNLTNGQNSFPRFKLDFFTNIEEFSTKELIFINSNDIIYKTKNFISWCYEKNEHNVIFFVAALHFLSRLPFKITQIHAVTFPQKSFR